MKKALVGLAILAAIALPASEVYAVGCAFSVPMFHGYGSFLALFGVIALMVDTRSWLAQRSVPRGQRHEQMYLMAHSGPAGPPAAP